MWLSSIDDLLGVIQQKPSKQNQSSVHCNWIQSCSDGRRCWQEPCACHTVLKFHTYSSMLHMTNTENSYRSLVILTWQRQQGRDGFRIWIRRNPTHFRKSEICQILKIWSCWIWNFCSTMRWLWRNILHIRLSSLGQIDGKYRPNYGRFSICTVCKHLKVPSQITMIFIIHC